MTTISVTCSQDTYTIGGTLSSLTANGLVLQNNGGDNLPISSGATSFQFSTPVAFGGSYNVTVQQQPTGLTCVISNGSGSNVTADVTNIAVSCGNLYVTNTLSNSIGLYNTVTGQAANSSLITGLDAPYGIAFGPNGHLYVGNALSSTVGEYQVDGTPVNPSLITTGLSGVSNLAFNPNNNHLYIVSTEGGYLGEYLADGTPVNTHLIGFHNAPIGFSIDSAGYLYVGYQPSGYQIDKYTEGGGVVNQPLISNLNDPEAIAIYNNTLYVGNLSSGTIEEYQLNGTPINSALITGLPEPTSLAFDPGPSGHLYISTNGNEAIGEYQIDGTPVNPMLITGLNDPRGIAFVPIP